MKAYKKLLVFYLVLLISFCGTAQKQQFDMVIYTAPKGWQQQQNEGGVQLSVTDKKTGAYAIALITKATASTAAAHENFNADWNKLVKGSVQVSTEPTMEEPVNENGWEIQSGIAHYTDDKQKGLATLLTATGGGQTMSVVLMTNTQQYEKELLAFLNSLALTPVSQPETKNSVVAATASTTHSGIVGMWVFYNTESSGMYNGFPQLTGGYMRREYVFYGDGTYLFRSKDWLLFVKDILFVYETGTYSIKGNQITLSPNNGKGEWWSKVSDDTKAWGKRVRASAGYKLEKTTYTVELASYNDNGETTLLLYSAKPTTREGQDGDKSGVQKYYYTSRDIKATLIDNPPGLKTGFEHKKLHTGSTTTNADAKQSTSNTQNKSTAINNNISAAFAGKIWESQSLEKHGAAYGNQSGFHTGGFWLYQHKFNADGTYQFVYTAASALATTPVNVLQYETGTYAVNGNQLIITPLKGANEEWSVGKINNGMSAEHIREVLETRIKRLKTMTRKLEKGIYPFSIEYWQGNEANALCLKHTQNTVREGSPGQNEQRCFFETTNAKAQNFNSLFK